MRSRLPRAFAALGAAALLVPLAPVSASATAGRDLHVRVLAPAQVSVGERLQVEADVSNVGEVAATALRVTVALPAQRTAEPVASSPAGCAVAADTVTCDLGDLAAGALTVVTVTFVPSAPGIVTTTATATADGEDAHPADDSDTGRVDVRTPVPDLALRLSAALTRQAVDYAANVTNRGTAPARGVVLTLALPTDEPATARLDSDTATGASCPRSGRIVTCSVGVLARDAAATVVVHVAPVSVAGRRVAKATLTARGATAPLVATASVVVPASRPPVVTPPAPTPTPVVHPTVLPPAPTPPVVRPAPPPSAGTTTTRRTPVTRRTGTPAAVRVKGVKLVKGVGLVRGEPLPNTGAPTGQLLALGLALLGVGLGCCRQARRLGAR